MKTRPIKIERKGYEAAPGKYVSERFEGMENVPIPPEDVRRKANLPERLAYASLAEELLQFYPEIIPPKIGEYVRNWPEWRQLGRGVLLAGASGTGKSWAAAALVNELLVNWMHRISVRVHWFSVPMGMKKLLDYRHFKNSDEYHELWDELTSCDLLVVDDLLHVSDFPQAKEYLFALYSERDERKLPIVTTCNGPITSENWTPISDVFNEPFVRRIRGDSKGFTLVLGNGPHPFN